MYLPGIPISSGYGARPQFNDFHYGVDYACPIGTRLPALVSGTIAFEGYINAAVAGYPAELIVILQADGYFIVYGHLSKTLVDVGQQVKQGDYIGMSGNSGFTSGPHLHIEKRRGTKSANKGLLAYPSEDITPLLEAYGNTGGGTASSGGSMTQEEHVKEIARLVLDVIESNPHYEEERPDIFMNHVRAIMSDPKPLGDRRWAKGIMVNNGVLNGPDMGKLRQDHEKALGTFEKENTKLRSDFEQKTVAFDQKISDLEEANQVLASQANEASALVKQKVEESNGLKDQVRDLKEKLAESEKAPQTPTGTIENYSAVELIRMGINKWLKGSAK